MVQEASVLIKLIHFGTKLNEDVDLTRLRKEVESCSGLVDYSS